MTTLTNVLTACRAYDKANTNLIRAKAQLRLTETAAASELRAYVEPRWSENVLAEPDEYTTETREIVSMARQLSPLNRNLLSKIIRDAAANLYGERLCVDVESGEFAEPEERVTVFKPSNMGQVVTIAGSLRRKTIASIAQGVVPKSLLRKALAELEALAAEIRAALND